MRQLRRGLDLRATVLVLAVGAMFIGTSASAQYVSGFENLIFGAPVGEPLTGQDNFYIPAGTTSVDYLVYTYLLNQLNIVQNPNGGTVFVGGTGPGDGATFARGQRDITLTQDCWEFSYDFCCQYIEPSPPQPPANNLGSFSGQPAPNPFIHLFAWVPGFEGTNYTAGYMFNDAAGTQFPQPGEIPGPEWDMLVLNHWYRSTMILDVAANQCVEVRIQDVSGGGAPVSFVPTGWYLDGGQAGSTGMTAHRFFAGGSAPGNSVCFDNVVIDVCATTAVEPATWGGIKNHFK